MEVRPLRVNFGANKIPHRSTDRTLVNTDSTNSTTSRYLIPALVFGLLVATGVAGRWGQPAWGATPIAAAALFAGVYFANRGVAILVPLLSILLSDQLLSTHDNGPVMFVVYACWIVPALMGSLLRPKSEAGELQMPGIARFVLCGLAPATIFFVVTNLAVWVFNDMYPMTLAGLGSCYAAAVPFYRNMLCGDVAYLALFTAAVALAGAGALLPQRSATAR